MLDVTEPVVESRSGSTKKSAISYRNFVARKKNNNNKMFGLHLVLISTADVFGCQAVDL